MKDNSKLTLGLVIVFAVTIGFFGGVYYQKKQGENYSRMQRSDRSNASMRGREAGMGVKSNPGSVMMGGAVNGEISAKDDNGITIKLTDGSSKFILVNSETKYTLSSGTDSTKAVIGEKIAVFGENNSDGTMTAKSIEFNPMMRGQQAK
ncbi:hypothetical protein KBD69_04085 [Candidatus Woesebacteria bacterium]|nr:hypothetical protein [Candidatus Woesebacteria bacterium]